MEVTMAKVEKTKGAPGRRSAASVAQRIAERQAEKATLQVQVSVRLTPAEAAKIKTLADKEKRTSSYVIREILLKNL
jgi:Ribbon-helix-helix protein, copG family